MTFQRQRDAAADAELTKRFHEMLNRVTAQERRRERRRPKWRMKVLGWVRMDVRMLR